MSARCGEYADLPARLGPRELVCQTVRAATGWRWASCPSQSWARSLWPIRRVLVELLADRAVALPPVSAKLAADIAAGLRG
jgi:hypothetical protein